MSLCRFSTGHQYLAEGLELLNNAYFNDFGLCYLGLGVVVLLPTILSDIVINNKTNHSILVAKENGVAVCWIGVPFSSTSISCGEGFEVVIGQFGVNSYEMS